MIREIIALIKATNSQILHDDDADYDDDYNDDYDDYDDDNFFF